MYTMSNNVLQYVDIKLTEGRVLPALQICSGEHHKYKNKQRKTNKNTESTTIERTNASTPSGASKDNEEEE